MPGTPRPRPAAGRREQTYQTVRASSEEGQTVNSREATALGRLMWDMVAEIQQDFRRLEGLVNPLHVEPES